MVRGYSSRLVSTLAPTRRTAVYKILQKSRSKKWKPRDTEIVVWNYILTTEIQSGTQFIRAMPEGTLYIVLGSTSEIISLGLRGSPRWSAYLSTMYGLAENEAVARMIYGSLRAYVITSGASVEVRRLAAYDVTTQTAYMSRYDGTMWKIEGSGSGSESEQITAVTNGSDDRFFVDDDQGVPTPTDIGPHGELWARVLDLNFAAAGLSGITPDQQRMALTIWILMLAFPDLMPTKPLLLIEGTHGSGKSLALQLLQLILMGISRPMIIQRNKEDDFGVILLRSPLAIFDNTDSFIDWIPDAICAYATDGSWNKRRLYTDDENMVIRPHAFIAIASKNPASFRREDVADRCIILRLERRASNTPARQLKEQILADRPRLLGEYLWHVGRVVDELRAGAQVDLGETFRMADYAAFARAVGRVMGWTPEAISEMLDALAAEQAVFINEEDPLVSILHRWVSYRPRMGPSNIGRLVPIFTLCSELETLAQAAQIQWKHTARTLMQKLRSPHIEREFRVEIVNTGNHKSFRLWRVSDAQLEIVPAGDDEVILG